MTKQSLAAAKKKYPVALYSFMRITYPKKAMEDFLEHPDSNPIFTYPPTLTPLYVQGRIERLQADLNAAEDTMVARFLAYRIYEAKLLKQFVDSHTVHISDEGYARYRDGMVSLYGALDKDYFDGALSYIYRLATNRADEAASQALTNVNWDHVALVAPSMQLFEYYKRLLRQHLPDMFDPVPVGTTPLEATAIALDKAGLADDGWQCRKTRHATNMSVSRHGKTINVGENYEPADSFRLQQIIAHEVYGHARRFNVSGHRSSGWEEEGVALVYEQLLAKRFTYKRMLRYVALGLAWGIDGTSRDFVQTYRIMVPLVRVLTGRDSDVSERIAFKETLRAFRGGNPAVPGMVLLKDKVYMESNLKVWQYLTDNKLDEVAFSRLVDGLDEIPERRTT